ncbi:hypothetical protein ACFO5K_14000 [Nocardia halotolerans]|uniref:Uncharacterized protein n=1 Tax=Nocardia halotolerans TaxID=1755878 RepID=A0ABV8VGP9_9NOCA
MSGSSEDQQYSQQDGVTSYPDGPAPDQGRAPSAYPQGAPEMGARPGGQQPPQAPMTPADAPPDRYPTPQQVPAASDAHPLQAQPWSAGEPPADWQETRIPQPPTAAAPAGWYPPQSEPGVYPPQAQPGAVPPGAGAPTAYPPQAQPGAVPPGAGPPTAYPPQAQPGAVPPGAGPPTAYPPQAQPAAVPPGAGPPTAYPPQAQPAAHPGGYPPQAVPAGGQPFPGSPGAYPQPGPYAPMPGGSVAPAEPREVPQNVRMAFVAMLVGAVVTLLSGAFVFTAIDEIRTATLDASDGVFRGSELDMIVYASVGGAVIGALITAGLWIWMAFACRAGKNWARITATVFFGINTLMTVFGAFGVAVDTATLPDFAFTAATFVIGLAAVILLWNRRSAAYFAPPAPVYPPYGYPPNGPW